MLRRLRRVCEKEYNVSPTFIVTSATIANPQMHVKTLLGTASNLHGTLYGLIDHHPKISFTIRIADPGKYMSLIVSANRHLDSRDSK